MELRNEVIRTPDGFEINVDIRFIENEYLSPAIFFVHGFKGFKDWGGFPYAMERLAEFGFIAISFNFTHNGVSAETPEDFSRLDLFAKNTFTRELDELGLLIDHFYDKAEDFGIDNEHLGLIGHSRGGGTSILKAKEDDRIKAAAVLASVSSFDRYTDNRKREWKAAGYFEVLNTRTNQMMRMDAELLYDLEKNKERLDIIKAVKELNKPLMIVHGKEDMAVSPDEAELLWENSNKELTPLHILENTGHTFGVEHPFKGSTFHFDMAVTLAADFMQKNL